MVRDVLAEVRARLISRLISDAKESSCRPTLAETLCSAQRSFSPSSVSEAPLPRVKVTKLDPKKVFQWLTRFHACRYEIPVCFAASASVPVR